MLFVRVTIRNLICRELSGPSSRMVGLTLRNVKASSCRRNLRKSSSSRNGAIMIGLNPSRNPAARPRAGCFHAFTELILGRKPVLFLLSVSAWLVLFISVNPATGQTWALTGAPILNYVSSVASSADGTKLVEATSTGSIGGICTSTNSGFTWTLTSAPYYNWQSVASSADGTFLVAVASALEFNAMSPRPIRGSLGCRSATRPMGIGLGLASPPQPTEANWSRRRSSAFSPRPIRDSLGRTPARSAITSPSSADGTKLVAVVWYRRRHLHLDQFGIHLDPDHRALHELDLRRLFRGWHQIGGCNRYAPTAPPPTIPARFTPRPLGIHLDPEQCARL